MPQVAEIIKNRRSYRSYQDRPVEQEKIDAVLRAAMYAPSAHHKQAWEFVVVTDSDKIKKLAEMKQWSEHIAEAAAVIVVCSPEWDNWLEDASIVGAHIYLEAAHQGLGTCWTQVRGSQTWDGGDCEDYVRQELSIPDQIRVLCLMPLGYPAQTKDSHDQSEYQAGKVHQQTW